MKYLILISLLNTQSIFAEDSKEISTIKVLGLQRTSEFIILQELEISEGQSYTSSQVQEGIARLRNTGLFSNIEYKLDSSEGVSILVISVKEKWTTIPIFKVASGGGVGQLTAGVYDPNVFGQRWELGAQYERLGDTNSGVVWLKKPRVFQSKIGISAQLWKINRLRTKYEQGTEDPVIKTGFLQKTDKYFLSFDRVFLEQWKAQVFYQFNQDVFSDDFTTDEVKAKLVTTGLPVNTRYHFAGVGGEYGKVKTEGQRINGSLISAEYRYGFSENKNKTADDFWQVNLGFNYYKTLDSGSVLAQRLLSGFTSTEVLQYWYYLGGLDRIRGFSDNRFAGRYYFLSNSEFRQPVFQKPWLILQGVGFFDVVSVSEEFDGLGKVDGASIGAGIRIILPKVYRSVGRIDYAQPIEKKDDMRLSLGVQHFF